MIFDKRILKISWAERINNKENVNRKNPYTQNLEKTAATSWAHHEEGKRRILWSRKRIDGIETLTGQASVNWWQNEGGVHNKLKKKLLGATRGSCGDPWLTMPWGKAAHRRRSVFTFYPNPFYPSSLDRLFSVFLCPLLPPVCLVNVKYSKGSFHIMYPRNSVFFPILSLCSFCFHSS